MNRDISGSISAEPTTRIMPENCQNVIVSAKKIFPSHAVSIGVKYPEIPSNPGEMKC